MPAAGRVADETAVLDERTIDVGVDLAGKRVSIGTQILVEADGFRTGVFSGTSSRFRTLQRPAILGVHDDKAFDLLRAVKLQIADDLDLAGFEVRPVERLVGIVAGEIHPAVQQLAALRLIDGLRQRDVFLETPVRQIVDGEFRRPFIGHAVAQAFLGIDSDPAGNVMCAMGRIEREGLAGPFHCLRVIDRENRTFIFAAGGRVDLACIQRNVEKPVRIVDVAYVVGAALGIDGREFASSSGMAGETFSSEL